ncbi:basic-leucine zipper transcription factor [Trichoderma chlorosporum]
MTSFHTHTPIMVDNQDFAYKCWPDQALTENLCPSEAFFSSQHHHQHQHLFDTSLHHHARIHVPHNQQHDERLGMSAPSFSTDASNSVFFQMPAQQMANVMAPSSSSSTPTPHHYRQDSPTSTHSGGSHSKYRSATRSTDGDEIEAGGDEAQAAIKRQRNTMAARKYRQKRLDRIADLERALSDMTGERDELKLKLARREAEVEALREVLGKK